MAHVSSRIDAHNRTLESVRSLRKRAEDGKVGCNMVGAQLSSCGWVNLQVVLDMQQGLDMDKVREINRENGLPQCHLAVTRLELNCQLLTGKMLCCLGTICDLCILGQCSTHHALVDTLMVPSSLASNMYIMQCRDCALHWRVCGVCAAALGEECYLQHSKPAGGVSSARACRRPGPVSTCSWVHGQVRAVQTL
jgi:hypothetical protein